MSLCCEIGYMMWCMGVVGNFSGIQQKTKDYQWPWARIHPMTCNEHILKKCRSTSRHQDKEPAKPKNISVNQLMTIYGMKDSKFMERTLRNTTSTATRDHQRPSRTPWKPHRNPGCMHNYYANIIISSRK